MNLTPGKMVYIQSYKHDGSLHRTWAMAFVLESDDERTVLVTNHTWVTESNGRKWYTREPAICYFYPHRWFNIISMIRNSGVYYYCNLASPMIWDSEALKYIDYDLDVKVFPNGEVKLLDEDEYEERGEEMEYPEEIKEILQDELDLLYSWIEEKKDPFDKKEIDRMFQKYLELVEKNRQAKKNNGSQG